MDISHQYNERLEVVLARSPIAEGFVAAGAVSTAVLWVAMPLDLGLRAAGLVWIAASALFAWRRLAPGIRLRIDHHGEIEVGGRNGVIRDGSFVAPWLTIVRWRPAGAWWDRSLLVAPDMLCAEDSRRLRVLLRFRSRAPGP